MSRIPYDNYNEKGIFMKKNIELDKQYAEPQQMNTKIEDAPMGEVAMALDILCNKIYVAYEAIDILCFHQNQMRILIATREYQPPFRIILVK